MATALSEPDRMLSPAEVTKLTGLSETTLWRMRRDGEFPKASPLSRQRIGWPAKVIGDWMEKRRAIAGEVS